ncbi:Tn7 transposase TnsA N-terminal domain-containing protein [Cupriavidus pinatubonensis]|uniref:TnsA endonuclease N-terminal domain-containing protein n=1 Tax=Cupriavidus pinatubonensis TaxID=248026 RepID=UPI001C732763|nr:TnsA endonuclease N-terminal domain-containing protein [Cupriavidus pinatubonensis]QYY30879.1 Tn7 transposase TnsA N-terminal domain-containing protein [Cupriavidus pinatubonensis]
MPARNVVTRSPHRRVGRIACPWFQPTAIEYESLLERDFVRLALLDLRVSSISHQPFFVDLGDLGKYVPDFLLIGPNQKLVVEVKPEVYVASARNKPRLARAKELLLEQGYRFTLATDKHIHKNGRHHRASILLRHARGQITAATLTRIEEVAARHPGGTGIGSLAKAADAPLHAILHLVGRRRLRLNAMLGMGESDSVYPLGDDHVRVQT